MGINKVCAIFKNNPKKGFTPKEIKEKLEKSSEGETFRPGTVRQWIKRLKTLQIIGIKPDSKYYLINEGRALQFLEKRYTSPKRERPTPKGAIKGITMVEEHLLKLEGNIIYPKETIDLWLSLGILKPPKPNDPAQQVSFDCESFKALLSLKSYRGSMYIRALDYKDKAEELFGSDFREQIENLVKSKHMGFTAETMVGFKGRRGELGYEVDSGSRTGMTEVEFKGKDELVTNAFENVIRKGADITIIEQAIFEVLDDMSRRHTRELNAINTVLNRMVDSMDYSQKQTQKTMRKITDTLETISKELTALHNAPPQPKLSMPKDSYKDVA